MEGTKTPEGRTVRFKKLSGHRWRIELEEHMLVIEKRGQTASLEHMSGQSIGVFGSWDEAKNLALRMLDTAVDGS